MPTVELLYIAAVRSPLGYVISRVAGKVLLYRSPINVCWSEGKKAVLVLRRVADEVYIVWSIFLAATAAAVCVCLWWDQPAVRTAQAETV